MISTVTTTTVTTIVTLTSGASLGVLASILLISLLGTKELVSTKVGRPLKTLGKYLNVSVLPLFLVFTLTVAIKVIELIT